MLVVDDDPVQLQFCRAILTRAGFGVETAADGETAIGFLQASRPHLTVLDSVLPGKDGLDVLQTIRSMPGLEMMPIIIASAISDVTSKLDYFAAGANDYLVKPVEAAEFVARIETQLRTGTEWTTRYAKLMDQRKVLRQRLLEVPKGEDPFETARSLLRAFPTELRCAGLVTVTDASYLRLAGQIAATDLVRTALGDAPPRERVAALPAGSAVETGPYSPCPMCGSKEPLRRGFVVPLGSSGESHSGLLVIGCSSIPPDALGGLVTEAADACGAVLSQQMVEWHSSLADREWVNRLVSERRFEVKYQPIVDLDSGTVVACEALARFPDAIGPEEAFGIAARFGQNITLEMQIVEEVIATSLGFPEHLATHVNVSPMAALAPQLITLLQGSKRHLVVEVTEHDLLDIALIIELRDALPEGVSLAVDDVGAGYAGLSVLLRLRPDEIKIDRIVVTGVSADPARQALVAGLVRFAEATGAGLVAEGIEHQADLECLRELGVRNGQGYLFSRALSAPDLVEFIARSARQS